MLATSMSLVDRANHALRRLLVLRGARSDLRPVRGNSIHAYRLKGRGSGPPVLMLHGLGSSANDFALLMTALARRFPEVWAIDLPGSGFSPLPAQGPLSVREHVHVVRAFVEDVVGSSVFLIGNSLGGAMGLFTAAETPSLVRALALLAPAGARMTGTRIAALKRSFAVGSDAEARAMTRRLFARAPWPLLLFAGQLRTLYQKPAVLRIIDEFQAADALSEAQLEGLRMPTLLVWGRSEKLLPYEGLDYFRAHLPAHAVVREVQGFGHMPQLEHPRKTARLLLEFASAQGLAPS
jgi:pimeloyl-ACP methyl ester carboxylesterase